MTALKSCILIASLALSYLPFGASAQALPSFGTVERVFPVGEKGTAWKRKCMRTSAQADVSAQRPGFYDRADRFEHDRPEYTSRGRRVCTPVPVAVGKFVGYRARLNAEGRIFDQFVGHAPRVGSRVRVYSDAQFIGYDDKAHKARPHKDWGDNYYPGYPYGERY